VGADVVGLDVGQHSDPDRRGHAAPVRQSDARPLDAQRERLDERCVGAGGGGQAAERGEREYGSRGPPRRAPAEPKDARGHGGQHHHEVEEDEMDHPEQGIEAEADEHGELRDDERRCERERAGNPGDGDRSAASGAAPDTQRE